MTDIMQRCREAACDSEWPCRVGDDAADEIKRLRDRLIEAERLLSDSQEYVGMVRSYDLTDQPIFGHMDEVNAFLGNADSASVSPEAKP